ncbi:MAG: metallophosphoesterase [Anaerolineae bacterium]|nr:metallophosphoesterase [Anaerolineae bacterium]
MKILTVSDVELSYIYSTSLGERFGDSDFVISCGDLPYYYLEYIISSLNVPLFYVRGNHASKVEFGSGGERRYPWGGIDLHRRLMKTEKGVLLGGIEGSLRYNNGPHQYSQSEMWWMVFNLVPGLLYNRLRHGRFLDIFVAHAPPWKIHDKDDRPHQGIKAYRWLINVFHPAIFLHGHIHIYRQDAITDTLVSQTRVINSYGHRVLDIEKQVRQPVKIINVK